jgi:hypothetical protein
VISGLSGKPEKLFADGLHVAGERYVLTKAEDRSLYARKVGSLFLPPIRLPPEFPRAMNLTASLRIWLTFLEYRVEKALSLSRPRWLSSLPTTKMV